MFVLFILVSQTILCLCFLLYLIVVGICFNIFLDNLLVNGSTFLSSSTALCLNYFLVFMYVPDLDSIGGLVPLLGYLKNSHANIRAKAADVVTTVVQNNPKSQALVMKSNGFHPLFSSFSSDPVLNVRIKALGAISCKYALGFFGSDIYLVSQFEMLV